MPNLEVKIASLVLKNPIIAASGTFGYGEEFNEKFYPIRELGAVVTKGIGLHPREGNPMPRIAETASGIINSIGLENVGVERFVSEKMPYLVKAGATVIVNIFGSSAAEYAEVARRLDGVPGIGAVEVNISCPNVASGGMQFGTCPKDAAKVARHVRKATGLPVIVKLSPNVTDIAGIADAAAGEGADAVSAINTLLAMGAARQQDTPVTGGLSGPAIKPVALRMVWQLCRKVRVPVIGIGGISSLEDVLEFFSAGAAAVQIGTANLVDPMVCHRIVRGLEEMQ